MSSLEEIDEIYKNELSEYLVCPKPREEFIRLNRYCLPQIEEELGKALNVS
jgi:hypothetical protein